MVRETPTPGYRLGLAPHSEFHVFEKPKMSFLSIRPEDRRMNAYQYPWDKPKAIVNKSARTRGKWRLVAFPDDQGVICYQTYTGIWPKSEEFDEWLLAAILNSPVANAFVFAREGKTDIRIASLKRIPVPYFTHAQTKRLRKLIRLYQSMTRKNSTARAHNGKNPSSVLMEIDSIVLDGYRMPARLERKLLDYFRDQKRQTSYEFPDYFSNDDDTFFNLSDYISPAFKEATAGALLKRLSA